MRTYSTIRATPRRRQRGFTLIEMMTTVAVLTIVMAVVFGALVDVQKSYKAEEQKVDTLQEAREFMDQFARDLHQAGFPHVRVYDKVALWSTTAAAQQDSRVAVGLVQYSPTTVWFEGDVDGDGNVESVRYTLQTQDDGTCPCRIMRAQIQKANGTAPTAQNVTANYNVALDRVLNSGGSGGTGTNGSRALSGYSSITTSSGVATTANDSLYAGYKQPFVFAAFDMNGNAVSAVDITQMDATGTNPAIWAIRSIRVVVNVQAQNPDLRTGMRTVTSMSQTAHVNNGLF